MELAAEVVATVPVPVELAWVEEAVEEIGELLW